MHLANTFRSLAEAVRRSGAVLIVAMFVSPVVFRVALLSQKSIELGGADVRGFLSDLAMSACVGLVVLLLSRLSRAAGWALFAAWLVANHANFEHVSFLGSFVDPTYASYLGDSTFLLGSGLAPSQPLLLASVASVSFLLFLFASPRQATRPTITAAIAVVAFGASLVLPIRDENVLWRQGHALQLNLGRAFASSSGRIEPAALPPSDLAGEPVVALPRPRTNVLLVMLESVSGAWLPSVASDHGIACGTKMPVFDALAKRGLLFTNFVSQQRQTNRGEYALLCGDHPRLITAEAKMSAYVRGGSRRCLPAILRDAGYETVYLQAASLAFMLKDQFMPRIGFERSLGANALPRAYARSEWGVDDRAFFEQASTLIDELRQGERPWFLALLTVGTHHPFLVPEDFEGGAGEGEQARAVAYLDTALGELFARLEEKGVLDDTLVLVTSDESAGLLEGHDDLTEALSQNWSVLAAFAPTREAARVAEVYAQSDVALSVLDYLGLAGREEHLTGRSVFRRYADPRTVYFANTYRRQTHALKTTGELVACREDFYRCTQRRFEPGRLFAKAAPAQVADAADVVSLRAMAEQSVADFEQADQQLQLITEREVEVSGESRYQIVFAGQYLSAAPGTRIDMELDVEIAGGEGELRLTHELLSLQGRHFGRWLQGLKRGDAVTLDYSFTTPERLEKLESRLFVAQTAGSGLRLHIREARLLLAKPVAGAKPGVELRREEVRRGQSSAATRGDGPSPLHR